MPLMSSGCFNFNLNSNFEDPACIGLGTSDDGAPCCLSVNCHDGSICNDPVEDFFDPTKPRDVCIHVVCDSDAACKAPKRCALGSICELIPCV